MWCVGEEGEEGGWEVEEEEEVIGGDVEGKGEEQEIPMEQDSLAQVAQIFISSYACAEVAIFSAGRMSFLASYSVSAGENDRESLEEVLPTSLLVSSSLTLTETLSTANQVCQLCNFKTSTAPRYLALPILYFLYLTFSTFSYCNYYTCSLHRGFSAFNIALDSTYMYPPFTCDYIGGVQYKLGGLLHSRTYLLLYHVTHYAIMETEWPCGSEWLSWLCPGVWPCVMMSQACWWC